LEQNNNNDRHPYLVTLRGTERREKKNWQ